MARELEERIMKKIGFSNNYQFYEGSNTCQTIRKEAVTKLEDAISASASADEEIAFPSERLLNLLSQIEQAEKSPMSLAETWKATSDIIAAHQNMAPYVFTNKEKLAEIENTTAEHLKSRYLPNAIEVGTSQTLLERVTNSRGGNISR